MLLPSGRPLLPPLRQELYSTSRARRRGPQINLCWALDILQRIPGPHQQRIVAKSFSGREGETTVLQQPVPNYSGSDHISKEQLGHSTWTLLHTLAAQWPLRPTKQQKKDGRTLVGSCIMPHVKLSQSAFQRTQTAAEASRAKFKPSCPQSDTVIFRLLLRSVKTSLSEFLAISLQVDVLTRIYPCAACAEHFGELVKCGLGCKCCVEC